MKSNDAREALDSIQDTDRKMAERMTWPVWRHAAFGAIEAFILLGLALPPAAMAACLIAAIGALSWITRDDRKRHGMFVSGYSSPPARPAMVLAFAIFGAGFIAILLTGGINTWSIWTPLIVGVVFVGETLASLWWQKLNNAALRNEGHGR